MTSRLHLLATCSGDAAAWISALAAMAAFIAAWLANRGSKNTRQAQTFLALDERYNAPEMNESLRTLREIWPVGSINLRGQDWLEKIEKPTISNDKEKASERAKAIRHVKSYFFDVAQLIKLGGPEAAAAEIAMYRFGLELFFQVVQPIEKARKTEDWPFNLIYKKVTDDGGKKLETRVNLRVDQLRTWSDC